MANVQLGEYTRAEKMLQRASAVVAETDEEERKKINSLMKKVRAGKESDRKTMEAQRAAMSKVFSSSTSNSQRSSLTGDVNEKKYSVTTKSLLPFHYSMKEVGLLLLAACFFLGLAFLVSAYIEPDMASIFVFGVMFVIVSSAVAMYLTPKLPRRTSGSRSLHLKQQ